MSKITTFFICLLSMSANAATPSFDSRTHLLTIPEMKIDKHSYSDGVLLLSADRKYQVQALTVPVMLSDSDNGQSIELKQGQFLEVKLKSYSTSGYLWVFDDKSINVIQRQGNRTIDLSSCPPTPSVGCSGYEIYTFKAINTGSSYLVLQDSRLWAGRAVGSSFKVKVTVK